MATQHDGSFFQAADLQGTATQWPSGLAAIVTFEDGAVMERIVVNYSSANTYMIAQIDPGCKPAYKAPCTTARCPLTTHHLKTTSDTKSAASNIAMIKTGGSGGHVDAYARIAGIKASGPLTVVSLLILSVLVAATVVKLKQKRALQAAAVTATPPMATTMSSDAKGAPPIMKAP